MLWDGVKVKTLIKLKITNVVKSASTSESAQILESVDIYLKQIGTIPEEEELKRLTR